MIPKCFQDESKVKPKWVQHESKMTPRPGLGRSDKGKKRVGLFLKDSSVSHCVLCWILVLCVWNLSYVSDTYPRFSSKVFCSILNYSFQFQSLLFSSNVFCSVLTWPRFGRAPRGRAGADGRESTIKKTRGAILCKTMCLSAPIIFWDLLMKKTLFFHIVLW